VRPGSNPNQMSAPTERAAPALNGGGAPTNSVTSPPRDRAAIRAGAPSAQGGLGFIIE
ncbi:MAG: type II and III secretion system protein family protein, partial [Mesorhizobium sp.]